jgi:hypothetical protein
MADSTCVAVINQDHGLHDRLHLFIGDMGDFPIAFADFARPFCMLVFDRPIATQPV